MILIINTSNKDGFEIILANKKNDFLIKKVKGNFNYSEKLLVNIDKLLSKTNSNISKLKGIGVVVGPGGFSSIRVGVATANALVYALNLPIVALKSSDFLNNNELVEKVFLDYKKNPKKQLAMPYYDRDPNITLPKK